VLLIIFTVYMRTHLPADFCNKQSSCFKLHWILIYLMELWNAVNPQFEAPCWLLITLGLVIVEHRPSPGYLQP
jgi:hypothetical protein